MKKLILLLFVAALASCGPQMYKTQSGGKDDVSYIIVLTEQGKYENVSVVVDGREYAYGEVYKVKAKRKAHPVAIESGRHNVKVVVGGRTMTDENIFIGLQETKTIVLQ